MTTDDRVIGLTRAPGPDAGIAPVTEVRAGGRVVARATTRLLPGSALDIHMECAEGHQPPWARRLLLHDLLTRATRAGIERVTLTIPLGDAEIVDALSEHCGEFALRAAGENWLVTAEIRAAQRVRAS